MHAATNLKILQISLFAHRHEVNRIDRKTPAIFEMCLMISRKKKAHGSFVKDHDGAERGRLIPPRIRLTNQVDAANCFEYDLAGVRSKRRWPLCSWRTFPRLHELSVSPPLCGSPAGWPHAERKDGGEQGSSVCRAGWGRPVSSSLTFAREMFQCKRYARHHVTSWSAAPCKSWTQQRWYFSH